MGVRLTGFGWASMALAIAIAFAACKDEPTGWPPKKGYADSEAKTSSPPVERGFTPAEIRRDKPVEIDTAGMASASDPVAETSASTEDAPIPPKTVVVNPAPASVPASAPTAKPTKNVEAQVATKIDEPATGKNPASAASGAVAQPGETGEWVLQVNVHRSEAEAKAQIAKLGQQGIPAYAIPVPTGDANLSGNYWRVRVGRFQSRADAQSYGKSVLEPKGLKFWVDKKTNEAKQGT